MAPNKKNKKSKKRRNEWPSQQRRARVNAGNGPGPDTILDKLDTLLPADDAEWLKNHGIYGCRDTIYVKELDVVAIPVGLSSFAYQHLDELGTSIVTRISLRGRDLNGIMSGSESIESAHRRVAHRLDRATAHTAAVNKQKQNDDATPPGLHPGFWVLNEETKDVKNSALWLPETQHWPRDQDNCRVFLAHSLPGGVAASDLDGIDGQDVDIAIPVGYDSCVYLPKYSTAEDCNPTPALHIGVFDAMLFGVDSDNGVGEDLTAQIIAAAWEMLGLNQDVFAVSHDA